MDRFDYFMPTRVVFGNGRITDLERCLAEEARRVLVVTDPGVELGTDAVQTITSLLHSRQLTVFSEVEPNPSFATVDSAAKVCREVSADIVIGLGGGSPMDAAKGVALVARNNIGGMEAIVDGRKPESPPLPVVCLPTTSGTGSEVTPFAVFSDVDGQTKKGYSNDLIFPALSIVDPELSRSMPPVIATDTGLDALTHAFEAFISLDASPMSDLFALQAMQIVRDHLAAAISKHPEAVENMALAATLAGIAITHAGTTLLHVMGYPLTVFHGVSHGRANAALLPEYLRFLREQSSAQNKVARVEEMFSTIGGIRRFVEGFAVSTNLRDYGIQKTEIPDFVEKVIVKDDLRITPASVGRKEIAEIFERALTT